MTVSDARVVRRHLDAVLALDTQAMVADYAPDAVLARPDRVWCGPDAIRAYFTTVPERLGGGRVEFTAVDEAQLEVRWRIVGGPGDGTCGRDRYVVRDGLISRQTVVIASDADF